MSKKPQGVSSRTNVFLKDLFLLAGVINVKKIFVLFFFFFSLGLESRVASKTESFLDLEPSEYKLSLITAGRGDEIYMLGGHLLLRISEIKENAKDMSVNWGIFNFRDPDFYFNYTLGKLDYLVRETPTQFVKYQYSHESDQRRLYENEIFLTNKQKETIVKKVSWWLKPENSTYRYHFYESNCSTIIRDLLSEALGPEFDKQLKEKDYQTFRHMGRRYFSNYPVFAFFAPLMFTSDADLPISYWERFRVPVEAPDILEGVKQVDDNGNILEGNLLGPKRLYLEGKDIPFESFEYSLYVLFFLLALFILSFLFKQTKGFLKLRTLGISLLLIGLFNFFWSTLMLLLWFLTEHSYTFHNAHLLILWPLDLLFSALGFYLLFKNKYPNPKSFLSKSLKLILKAHVLGLVLQFLLWQIGWIKQDVSFIYFYLVPPFILFGIAIWQDLKKTC